MVRKQDTNVDHPLTVTVLIAEFHSSDQCAKFCPHFNACL
ncbi:hypothetical protein EYZ11_012458 [Aspergillus tanneri]|uniref:Uncharacterized protein n=1 Tax=Aspergillus tanneri TaxID=1220188 RepID=A0A4S3J068_9EURO|nr:hypothetical protein EYZ11_012458 [Aspergillus tanneri]